MSKIDNDLPNAIETYIRKVENITDEIIMMTTAYKGRISLSEMLYELPYPIYSKLREKYLKSLETKERPQHNYTEELMDEFN